jgi:hypothetical protein
MKTYLKNHTCSEYFYFICKDNNLLEQIHASKMYNMKKEELTKIENKARKQELETNYQTHT